MSLSLTPFLGLKFSPRTLGIKDVSLSGKQAELLPCFVPILNNQKRLTNFIFKTAKIPFSLLKYTPFLPLFDESLASEMASYSICV